MISMVGSDANSWMRMDYEAFMDRFNNGKISVSKIHKITTSVVYFDGSILPLDKKKCLT